MSFWQRIKCLFGFHAAMPCAPVASGIALSPQKRRHPPESAGAVYRAAQGGSQVRAAAANVGLRYQKHAHSSTSQSQPRPTHSSAHATSIAISRGPNLGAGGRRASTHACRRASSRSRSRAVMRPPWRARLPRGNRPQSCRRRRFPLALVAPCTPPPIPRAR